MNNFKKVLDAVYVKHVTTPRMRTLWLAAPIAIITVVVLTVSAHPQHREPYKFNLVPASDTVRACLGQPSATVAVFPRGDTQGVDTLDLKAEGLPPNTSFTVFLTELADIPFGASQYIAEFKTNAAGRGSVRVDAIIEEAFAIVGGVPGRKELNHVVLWFADQKDDDACFAPPAKGPTTPFDGDGEAGIGVLSSKNFLPNAPLP